MKKILSLTLAIAMSGTILTGCGSNRTRGTGKMAFNVIKIRNSAFRALSPF